MIIVLIKPSETAMSLEELDANIRVVDMSVMDEPLTSPFGETVPAIVSYRSEEFTRAVLLDSGYCVISVMAPVNPDAE